MTNSPILLDNEHVFSLLKMGSFLTKKINFVSIQTIWITA